MTIGARLDGATSVGVTVDDVELAYAGAFEQARLIRDGEVSARELMQVTLARIDALNPRLNAYRVVFAERALGEAVRVDASVRRMAW